MKAHDGDISIYERGKKSATWHTNTHAQQLIPPRKYSWVLCESLRSKKQTLNTCKTVLQVLSNQKGALQTLKNRKGKLKISPLIVSVCIRSRNKVVTKKNENDDHQANTYDESEANKSME